MVIDFCLRHELILTIFAKITIKVYSQVLLVGISFLRSCIHLFNSFKIIQVFIIVLLFFDLIHELHIFCQRIIFPLRLFLHLLLEAPRVLPLELRLWLCVLPVDVKFARDQTCFQIGQLILFDVFENIKPKVGAPRAVVPESVLVYPLLLSY